LLPQPRHDPDTYTVEEVAEIMRVSPDSIYRACRQEQFPHVKIGRLTRIPRRAFERWRGEEAGLDDKPSAMRH
jgi:excisionase family DNA binding protein